MSIGVAGDFKLYYADRRGRLFASGSREVVGHSSEALTVSSVQKLASTEVKL